MLSTRKLLIPGFRDVPGVKAELINRMKEGELDDLIFKLIESCQIGIVRFLLDLGVDKDVKSFYDIYNPCVGLLHVASMWGHADIVRLLLDVGADKDVKDENCSTPLHLAAGNGKSDIVRLLLDAGADINVKTYKGHTPLHRAIRSKHIDIVMILLNAGADKEVKDMKIGRAHV